ncbi:MAG: type IV secretory system conjugative DNA transfer family protein [Deltaproteobacteria bacterium]|nr:type IV secretory system conjugative DNA transfer family protein [Deltaproteobacteria bacterium]
MNFYPPMLALTILFAAMSMWNSGLMGYPILVGIGFAVMLVLRYYSALWVIGLAVQTHTGFLRYFLLRSSIMVATASPLVLVAAAYAFNLSRFVVFLSVALAAFSAGLTGEHEYLRLAAYYPRYSWLHLLGSVDWFAGVGVAATAAVPLGALFLRRDRPGAVRRAASALHGASDWLPIETAAGWFGSGGLIVGEAYRPDRQPRLGGSARLLRYDGDSGSGHMLVFAGSGGYKTTATVIPSALEWCGGLVCLDPALEVFPRVYVARRNMSRRLVTLNPESRYSDGFNALDWIDTSSDRALLDIQSVVAWLCGETPGERSEDYFRHAARALLGCLLADILFAPEIATEEKTLALLRRRVSLPVPELKDLLGAIYLKGSNYGFGFPAQLAGNLKDITEKQFAGFYGEAGNATSWLAIPSLARLVCGNSFRTRHLLSGKLDVFINVPVKALGSTPQSVRVILGALLNSVYEARGRLGGRILFLLDEVARLGYMSILETARDAGRKYGVNLCLLYQSLGQLRAGFGEGGQRAWFDSAFLKCFASIQDLETAEMLSRACGEFTALGDSFSEGSGSSTGRGHSHSRHQSSTRQPVARRLIKPEEIMQRMQDDEQIVLIRNAAPLRCGRAIYFRRPEMLERVQLRKVTPLRTRTSK